MMDTPEKKLRRKHAEEIRDYLMGLPTQTQGACRFVVMGLIPKGQGLGDPKRWVFVVWNIVECLRYKVEGTRLTGWRWVHSGKPVTDDPNALKSALDAWVDMHGPVVAEMRERHRKEFYEQFPREGLELPSQEDWPA